MYSQHHAHVEHTKVLQGLDTGEVGSKGKGPGNQSKQAISYLHYLLLARPDLDVAQGLLTNDDKVSFFFEIGGEGIWQFNVEWKDPDLNKSLYAFIYRLYKPGNFADPSYITKVDEKTMEATYTIKIKYPGGLTECSGFYSIYAGNPFATHTHALAEMRCDLADYAGTGWQPGGLHLTSL